MTDAIRPFELYDNWEMLFSNLNINVDEAIFTILVNRLAYLDKLLCAGTDFILRRVGSIPKGVEKPGVFKQMLLKRFF